MKNKVNKIKIISEIGINHDGSFNIAKKLIHQSREIGCDYVKFQIRNIKEIYHPDFLKDSLTQKMEINIFLMKLKKLI